MKDNERLFNDNGYDKMIHPRCNLIGFRSAASRPDERGIGDPPQQIRENFPRTGNTSGVIACCNVEVSLSPSKESLNGIAAIATRDCEKLRPSDMESIAKDNAPSPGITINNRLAQLRITYIEIRNKTLSMFLRGAVLRSPRSLRAAYTIHV